MLTMNELVQVILKVKVLVRLNQVHECPLTLNLGQRARKAGIENSPPPGIDPLGDSLLGYPADAVFKAPCREVTPLINLARKVGPKLTSRTNQIACINSPKFA